MILNDILIYIGTISSLTALVNLLGISKYNIEQTHLEHQKRQHPHSSNLKKRPVVSAIVYAQNNEDTIEACLNSLLKNSYRKLELIVVDNASTDHTGQRVRQFIAQNKHKHIKFYAKRQKVNRFTAAKIAGKKYANGELILLMNADYLPEKNAIRRAVEAFNLQPKIDILSVGYQIKSKQKISNLYLDFGFLIRNQLHKASAGFNCDYFSKPGEARFYSKVVFGDLNEQTLASPLLLKGDRNLRVGYCSQAQFLASSDDKFFSGLIQSQVAKIKLGFKSLQLMLNKQNPAHSSFLIWFRLPLDYLFATAMCLLPGVLIYFSYLALFLHQAAFLLMIWGVLGLIFVNSVIEADRLKLSLKLKYILLLPLSFGLFYIYMYMQYVSVVCSLFKTSDEQLA